jgi:hypothetical protein
MGAPTVSPAEKRKAAQKNIRRVIRTLNRTKRNIGVNEAREDKEMHRFATQGKREEALAAGKRAMALRKQGRELKRRIEDLEDIATKITTNSIDDTVVSAMFALSSANAASAERLSDGAALEMARQYEEASGSLQQASAIMTESLADEMSSADEEELSRKIDTELLTGNIASQMLQVPDSHTQDHTEKELRRRLLDMELE